jgi:ferredoxin
VRVAVDRSVCVAHGQCEYTDPDHFTVDDEGVLELVEDPPAAARESVLRAVDACPVRALTARD